ncbi:MAG TPA: SDR family oxidoreductase [Gemmatimonadaceae bacterium]
MRITCFVTGATGLLGARVVRRLLEDPDVRAVYALVRAPAVFDSPAVVPVLGDVGAEGLGIAPAVRARLAREVTTVVHCAATTSFSQTLDEARATNTEGTRRLLDLAAGWHGVTRFVFVSTAFVAGARTGVVPERAVAADGWINAYERSKAEAEVLVRAARGDWTIARPSTVVCDDASGRISQVNAVHRALRLYFGGLAAMLPATADSALDVVTADHAARGIARAALAPYVEGETFHLCAGRGAMPLEELLDVSYDAFQRSPAWRQKGIARPVLTDLATYRLFESAIDDAGSVRVRQAVRSLGHFVPQLAYPKRFETTGADTLLGATAPAVASFWGSMVHALVGAHPAREAA